MTDDPSLIRDMALAGCTGVFVGFESLSDDNLADAHKKTPKTADYARRVRMLHDYGIQVNGSSSSASITTARTSSRAPPTGSRRIAWSAPRFTSSRRIPRRRCFGRWKRKGRLLHRDWTLYDTGHAVFRPKHMTPEELEHGYAWIYQRLFSHASIWRRRPAGLAGGPAVPGDVVSLQALEPLLAFADQARPGQPGMEAAGRDDAPAARPLPAATGAAGDDGRRSGAGRLGGSLMRIPAGMPRCAWHGGALIRREICYHHDLVR